MTSEPTQVLNLNTCPNDTNGDGDCHLCAHLAGKCQAFRQLAWLAEMEKPSERTALHLKYFKGFTTPEKVNRKFIRCVNFLEDLFGLHHIHQSSLFKNDCTNPWCEILLYGGASFATVDGPQLTSLVLMAHDHCIRVDVSPCNMKYLKITLYPRDTRVGGNMDRHQTIEAVIADWRSRHPYDSTSPQ